MHTRPIGNKIYVYVSRRYFAYQTMADHSIYEYNNCGQNLLDHSNWGRSNIFEYFLHRYSNAFKKVLTNNILSFPDVEKTDIFGIYIVNISYTN